MATSPKTGKSSTMKCLAHSKSLKIYCEDCHQLICRDCTVKLHRDHNYDLVTDVFPKYKHQIERGLQLVKRRHSKIDAALQALEEREKQIKDKGEMVEQEIHDTAEQAINTLKKRMQESIKALQESEKELRDKVKAAVDQKTLVLQQQIEAVEKSQPQLKSCQEDVEKKLRTGSQEEVVEVKHELVEHMRALTDLMLDPVENAEIDFEPSEDDLSQCSKLGEIGSFLAIVHRVVAKGKGKEFAIIGQKTSFEITTSSKSKPSIPLPLDLLSCQLTAPDNPQPVECTVTPTQPESCTVHYTPAVRGRHQLKITVGGNMIPPYSPFTVDVLPPTVMRDRPLSTIPGLSKPYGVAVSERGEVVVSQHYTNTIKVFNRKGENYEEIRSFGTRGSDEGEFRGLRGIALSQDGHLLVVDGGNHRIQLLTLKGKALKAVGHEGNGELQFRTPCGIAVHPSGRVFIADTDNHRIQVLHSDLTYSHTFGSKGCGEGEFYSPMGVAFDSYGKVYVADRGNNCIQIFTSDGNFISSFDGKKSQEGQLKEPVAICIDSATDTVYVSEKGNDRVSVFDISGNFLKPFCSSEREGGTLEPRGLAVDSTTGNLLVCGHWKDCVFIY